MLGGCVNLQSSEECDEVSERLKFDIGIIVPLNEEFRYVVEIAPQIETIPSQGTFFYRLDFGAVTAISCIVGQMGTSPALHATARLLGIADIKLLVVLGLGGALDEDIAIGDVVVAADINEYQANSKAESSESGYQFRYSGRNWPLNYQLREAISHFEFSGAETFARWKSDAEGNYSKIMIEGKETICPPSPSLRLGPVASGNVVAASSSFVEELKRINRKFVAIDMEAAGVALAATDRVHPLPCLVVRGISDHANSVKKHMDKQGSGVWRGYCVRNATSFLRHLLTWDGFLIGSGLKPMQQRSDGDELVRELVRRMRLQIGGAWIVGVAFGIYSHGPCVQSDGSVCAMDLNRLRLLDARISGLIDAVSIRKAELLRQLDVNVAVEEFSGLIEAFRRSCHSNDLDDVLTDFDRVVSEILCPSSDNEQIETLIIESDRIEEYAGPEAVIEFLGGITLMDQRVRERFVDALAKSNKWKKLLETLDHIDLVALTRRELEHYIYASAREGGFDRAKELMRHHLSTYKDNISQVFRSEMNRNYPGINGGLQT